MLLDTLIKKLIPAYQDQLVRVSDGELVYFGKASEIPAKLLKLKLNKWFVTALHESHDATKYHGVFIVFVVKPEERKNEVKEVS